MTRFQKAFQQMEFLRYEGIGTFRHRWWRLPFVIFSDAFVVLAVYRLDRCFYLLLGKLWPLLRLLLSPVGFLLGPWTGRSMCSIHYEADLGKGLHILHPELGVLVTSFTVAGNNLILTGGNLIGSKRRNLKHGDISLGADVLLGAHAVILGPIVIGNNVKVGAGSVAIDDIKENQVVFGVPAVSLFRRRIGQSERINVNGKPE